MKYKANHGLKGRVNNPAGRTKEYKKANLCIQIPAAKAEQIKRIIKKIKRHAREEWLKQQATTSFGD